jgi:hypothetical protein
MSFRKTGIYLLGFLCLLVVYYHYEIRGKVEQAKREQREQEARRVFPFPSTAVQSIRIFSAEAPAPIQLQREEAGWRLIEPITAEGNQEEIGKILEALGEVKMRRIVEETPSTLEPFGLDKPVLRVEVSLHDGQQFSLLFGNPNPTNTAFYAKKAEEPRVFLVALGFKYRLGKGVEVLQAKQKKETGAGKGEGVQDPSISILTESSWRKQY